MKHVVIATAVLGALAVSVPALGQPAAVETYEAPITGAKGESIGKVVIRSGASATLMRVEINPGGLTPGWHGIHVHAVGNCSDVGEFQLSKGHVNHDGSKHGMLNPDGPDDGDLPNVFANQDGSVHAEVAADVPLTGEPGLEGLKDSDGSALVIHANEDDHTSQPIGNAGARVACAVIK